MFNIFNKENIASNVGELKELLKNVSDDLEWDVTTRGAIILSGSIKGTEKEITIQIKNGVK